MAVKQWIERRRMGRGYQYWHNAQLVTDREQLAYYKSLRVPPAWQHVQIAVSKRAKILAIGTDAAGRRQYIYHPNFRAKQEQAKFDRLTRFAKALPRLRNAVERHLQRRTLDRQKVLACIVQLMDEAYFRIGNDIYAKTNKSYGLTTLRSKHTNVEGATITFDFTGKSGQRHTRHITDRRLARIIKQLDELPGYNVFKYLDDQGNLQTVSSTDVNTYLKAIMGDGFSAKDFRTWGGTVTAINELVTCAQATSERERKKVVTACVKKVARQLGNTPAIARGSYIDPRVLAAFIDGKVFPSRPHASERTISRLTHSEQLALTVLLRNI